ncbi:hypothetical protein JL475_05495 [Streptomyces sp. M2CJ-2]|uniref:hypothetical protein n=1 Tax=Streptomyces sp. M2CJ-2 TaxID=2803948 RepID=UPI00192089E0|nr:hypothetical protein [Streptomyces sp. M2CJ-2]MBL3665463.1 hypothetical protein [Streptomyces sp. M2CJ-2]
MPEQPSEEPTRPEPSTPPDDVWDKFFEDSERDIRASAPKEPSARARMVTERLRAMDEAQARSNGDGGKRRWGRNKPAAQPALPEGWRTGPAWQEMNGRTTRRRTGWSVVGVLVAVVVAVVAVNPSGALSWLPGDLGDGSGTSGTSDGMNGASAAPLAPETARPTSAPSAALPVMPTRDRPFAGSPALRWESGAEAIRLPEGKAKAVNGVSAASVEAALEGARDFLIASNLDHEVIMGAEPKKALALLDPLMGDYLAELRAGLRKPTVENDPVWIFTRFDPDDVELVDDVRVRGRLTVEPVRGTAGKAVVKGDYTFVYALARPGEGEVARVIARRVIEVEAVDPARFQATDGRIWLADVKSEIGNHDCRESYGVIRPQFLADLEGDPMPTGEERDPYDRSRSLDGVAGECGVVTRT